jgi:transposase, IS5 family
MIGLRREAQKTLWEGVVNEDVKALWEAWMIAVDPLLSDEELVVQVYEAQGERHEKSRTRGRWQTPAETVLRLLLLKHVRNWSYDVVEREVRANLVYRDFTRIGLGKVPDAKTLARIGQAIGGEVIAELHRRWVEMAQEKGVVAGRKMRVDTTVVESNIHYPTDSSLLGDGARVLTRTMKKIEKQAGKLKRKLRDRTRSVRKQVLAIALSGRVRGSEGEQRRQQRYGKLLHLSRQILNDTRRVMAEVEELGRVKRKRVEAMMEHLEQMSGRMKQVMEQTKARIFAGWTQMPGKLVSIFEAQTEIIRKGKASKPTEFGKLVQIQEAENQIITHYEIFEHRPSDRELLLPAIEAQQNKLGRVPRLVTADAGFYSQAQERAVKDKGVPWVAVPNRQTRSAERKKLEKAPWFKKAQAWRTGCEGRISVLKRRHGLSRCRYPGMEGMKRWVGMGVLADNVINLGKALAEART